ncbi:hypothetical protein C8F04DRAFT_267732 [Mycena alexandri]|uniref:Uncharacterized protein n=1 Tax=Mycena alexandri TaxID=1745969 RepID=A0AAD6S6F6_9AGAR|nr:hypothetical protein C8F04DRAFT_267732 [Mycena alexandri]
MGIFKRPQWARKRPREPGRSPTKASEPSQLPTKRFRFFKKQQPHGIQSSTRGRPDHRLISKLDVATATSEFLLAACEGPFLGMLKVVIAPLHLVCQKLQTVRSNKHDAAQLQTEAMKLGERVDAIANACGADAPELRAAVEVLEEAAGFLNKCRLETTAKPKWKWRWFWSIDEDKAKIANLRSGISEESNRLRDMESQILSPQGRRLVSLATSQSFGPCKSVDKITPHNMLSEFIKIFERTDTSIRLAFFS